MSGWADDFVGTGGAVRTSALALITAYLATGRDVVLPQLIVAPSECARLLDLAPQQGWTVVDTSDGDAALARLAGLVG